MTTKISDVVEVTITRETRTVSQRGFGTALILGSSGAFTAREVRSYSDIDEVADDFDSADPEYKAANALFAQSPCPDSVKISQRATPVAQVQTLTFSADLITGNVVDLMVDDVAIASVPFNTSHDQTMADLKTALAATDPIGTATCPGAGSRVITMTAAIDGVPFAVTGVVVTGGATQATGTVAETVANVGITEDLNAIVLNDDDWYALLETSRTEQVVKLAATWVEAHMKIFGTASNDADIKAATLTDIAAVLHAQNRTRSFVCYNATPSDWIDAGWIGRCIAEDNPATLTWKFKEVSGPTASSLTSTERANILNKNCNTFVSRGGVDMMEEGTMAEGEFIDVICGIDWITSRMQENIFQKLVNADKIPYTDAGVAIIEAQIRATLENAMRLNILAADPDSYDGKEYYLFVPKVADISDTDKGNRLLPDIVWEATLAGAIHKVKIRGRVAL